MVTLILLVVMNAIVAKRLNLRYCLTIAHLSEQQHKQQTTITKQNRVLVPHHQAISAAVAVVLAVAVAVVVCRLFVFVVEFKPASLFVVFRWIWWWSWWLWWSARRRTRTRRSSSGWCGRSQQRQPCIQTRRLEMSNVCTPCCSFVVGLII